MYILNKIVLYLFFLVCLVLKYQVSCEKCILQNSSDVSKNKLLESILFLQGTKFLTSKDGFSYTVTVCSDLPKVSQPNASVTRTLINKNTTTILGRYTETDIVGLGEHQILLTYSGGDPLNESVTCNDTKWKSLIFISCDYNVNDISILDPLNGGCFAVFNLKTSLYCPTRQSAFFKWLLVVFIIVSAYFICGILYKRYSEGAKGWEQLPHHDFWRNPLQHFMGCLSGKDDIQIPQNQHNDLADEPLLRP